jgi:uncharacterized protein YndB with AHSA1/START domain
MDRCEVIAARRDQGTVSAKLLGAIACCATFADGPAAMGEVMSAGASGFAVRETAHIAAAPDRVYAALVLPGRWWNPEHTFSGDAANLTLDAKAGGCFCEKLREGGSVQHLTVVRVAPGKTLVLRGALGPFQQQGTDGALAIALAASGSGTDLTLTYTLGGYLTLPGGFEQMAKAADAMLAEQISRLQRFVETGSPASRP